MAPIEVQQASFSTLGSNQGEVSDSLLSTAPPPTIVIRQFRAEDLTQVLELFQDGLMPYTHEDDPLYPVWVSYIAASLKKDMAAILGHYVGGAGNFWVTTATNSHLSDPKEPSATHPASTIIVGAFAIQKHSDDVGKLRRVSVRADHRRFGIGKLLFNHAQQWAKEEQKFKKLELSARSSRCRRAGSTRCRVFGTPGRAPCAKIRFLGTSTTRSCSSNTCSDICT